MAPNIKAGTKAGDRIRLLDLQRDNATDHSKTIATRYFVAVAWYVPHPLLAYSAGGMIMMWAPAVPGNINHGPPGMGISERPVDSAVAHGV